MSRAHRAVLLGATLLAALGAPTAAAARAANGDEHYLLTELVALLEHRQPASGAWRGALPGPEYFSGAGSQNLPLLRAAAQCVAAPGPACELFRGPIPAYQMRAYEGSEEGSIIYGTWHLVSWAAVAHVALSRGDVELAKIALDWLRFGFAVREVTSVEPGGPILVAAARSGGHEPPSEWLRYHQDRAFGRDIAAARARLKSRGEAPGNAGADEWRLGEILAPVYRRAVEGMVDPVAELVASHRTFRSGRTFLRTTGGAAFWLDDRDGTGSADPLGDQPNPNTTSISCTAWSAATRTLEACPPRGGWRVRQKFEVVEVERRDGALYWSSTDTQGRDLYGRGRVALPPGEVVYELWMPPEGRSWQLFRGPAGLKAERIQ